MIRKQTKVCAPGSMFEALRSTLSCAARSARRFRLRAIAAAFFAIAGAAFDGLAAQDYPSRPVTIVVPYPAGGTTDAVARLVAEHLRTALGQSFIVENVSGAGGTVGMTRVARGQPDGYSIVMGNLETLVFAPATLPIQYNPLTDFEPVALVPGFPFLIASANAVPAKNLRELITWLKANSNNVSQATVGAGTTTHLCSLLMQSSIGATWSVVPYRGGAPAMQDLAAGRVNLMCSASGTFLPLVRAGQVRAYAVTAPSRMEAAPEIPTVDEAGWPGMHVAVWNAFYLPKGTPKDLVAKLNRAVVAAMKDQTLRKRVVDMGLDMPPEDNTPAALHDLLKAEIEKWRPIITRAALKPQ